MYLWITFVALIKFCLYFLAETDSQNRLQKKAVLGLLSKLKHKSSDQVLADGRAKDLQNGDVVRKVLQFRNPEPVDGNLDVYWLYDDGGLTLLGSILQNYISAEKISDNFSSAQKQQICPGGVV
jgi:hypothetical protein